MQMGINFNAQPFRQGSLCLCFQQFIILRTKNYFQLLSDIDHFVVALENLGGFVSTCSIGHG